MTHRGIYGTVGPNVRPGQPGSTANRAAYPQTLTTHIQLVRFIRRFGNPKYRQPWMNVTPGISSAKMTYLVLHSMKTIDASDAF
jgi:hypothetical protein